MDLDIYIIAIAIVGGLVAGTINTLAGNGSTITLAIFTEVLGLPGNIANGTNRIGILAQSFTTAFEFNRHGLLKMPLVRPIIVPMLSGVFLGIYLAVNISNEGFEQIFGMLLIALFFIALVKPKRWLSPQALPKDWPIWLTFPLYFILGIYGGFIQMGMGVFFLAAMVLLSRYPLMQANAVKIFVVGIYTVFALFIFHWKGLVDWKMGSIVAIGQAAGGWFTANLASRFKWMEKVAYYLLIIIIFSTIVFFYDLVQLIGF